MRKHGCNSVYFGSEKKILKAFSKVLVETRSVNVKTRQISKAAGIANSSFYIHYHSLTDLIEKNEEKILDGLNLEVRKMARKYCSLEQAYRNILLYLYKHRDFLDIIMKIKNVETPMKILRYIKPLIDENWERFGDKVSEYIFLQFSFTAMVEFLTWQSERYSLEKIGKHAHNLANLTISAPSYFGKLYY